MLQLHSTLRMANTQLNCAFKSRKPQLITCCCQTLECRDWSKKLGQCKEYRFNDSYWFIRWNAYNQVLLRGYWFCTLQCWFTCNPDTWKWEHANPVTTSALTQNPEVHIYFRHLNWKKNIGKENPLFFYTQTKMKLATLSQIKVVPGAAKMSSFAWILYFQTQW